MEYGIQRRGLYVIPPEGPDLAWLFDQFQSEEVWRMFGFSGPSRARIMRAYRTGSLVSAIIRLVRDDRRIGFVTVFAPAEDFDFWEFGYGIPDPADRDAFSALNTTDAVAHYMFEHLGVEALGWRTRSDNRAADAIVRRLGYTAFDSWAVNGHAYTFYRIDRAAWDRRRRKLDLGEESHPSGLGCTFVALLEWPFTPVRCG